MNYGQAPVLFELDASAVRETAVPVYDEISRFPSVRRDLAVVIDSELPVSELLTEVRKAAGSTLREVRVFDIYTGEGIESGLKSVALGLILQETSRTLTELEIERISNNVVEQLSSKFNASIRE